MRIKRWIASVAVLALGMAPAVAGEPRSSGAPAGPLAGFELPESWKAEFWASPDAEALRTMDLARLASLVPTQAGFRFCRCPACDAPEQADPLTWSIRKPEVVTCRKCGASFPNDKIPAQTDKKTPEETITVEAGVIHHYPYHTVEPDRQKHDGERLYLAARRDYEAREYLSKAALYAAVRSRRTSSERLEPNLSKLACVLILRFAQVYPHYALHLDQPGQPKFLEPAHQPPPYRRGYGTAKWDWSGNLDVPLNLVIAYALVRDDPALAEAGRLLNDPDPARTIERDLFGASARFVADQPRELDERELQADRGLLAVARLLRDDDLMAEATRRLGEFSERGFYHDGYWRQGDTPSHRRVVGMFDGWMERLWLWPGPGPANAPESATIPILGLARSAGGAVPPDRLAGEVRQVGWPAPEVAGSTRLPGLLGGVGIARLAVGAATDSLDLELCGIGQFGSTRSKRQALRLSVGGRTVLGDLDDLDPRPDGWDRASSSHNTVVVDGLNQRETPRMMREPAAGGEFLFYAADPDFQVAVLDDPRSYPRSTTRYRQTVVACSGSKTRYAVSVFEVAGGLQHDQFFHARAGDPARWEVPVATRPGPDSLLPPTIPYLNGSKAEDGRWFVQSYGEFGRMNHGMAVAPSMARLVGTDRSGVRLHLLGDAPFHMVTAETPRQPTATDPARSALILRRISSDGSTLESTFVTVFEPIGSVPSLTRVGKMTQTPGFVVLYLETPDGPEHLVINLRPGTSRTVQLADGRDLMTDGLVVRARRDELMLAGGTAAVAAGVAVRQPAFSGRILATVRYPTPEGRGWFETDAVIPASSSLVGRTLIIRHGDQTAHGWTLTRVESAPDQRVRLHVREEPGFRIEGDDRAAHYYQFPQTTNPGPHTFQIATIQR